MLGGGRRRFNLVSTTINECHVPLKQFLRIFHNSEWCAHCTVAMSNYVADIIYIYT